MKSALIVPYRYLGDTLLATPLARSLKQQGYRVEWLVHQGSQHLLDRQDFADAVHVLNSDSQQTKQITRQLWRKFDVAFVINGTDRLTAIARLAAKKVYATLTQDRFSDAWKRLAVSAWTPFTAHTHTMVYVQRLAQLAGFSLDAPIGLQWSKQDSQHALQQAGVNKSDFILLHPFARVRYKYWPDEHWQKLIQLISSAGFDIVISGSEADEAKAEGLFSDNMPANVHLCCGRLNWRELSALTAHAKAYIGVDTANTHLAATTATPTLALFGPTDPRLWGPWPAHWQQDSPWQDVHPSGVQQAGNVSIVQGAPPCVPCQQEGCERHVLSPSSCLESIRAKHVWSICLESMRGVENMHG